MQKIKVGIIKTLKILLLLFFILMAIGYFNKTSKQENFTKLVKEYKQKIIQNGWNNETIALITAAVEVNLKYTNQIDCSKNTLCYKNMKLCLSSIFINTRFTTDSKTNKIINSKQFKECLKAGDSDSFSKFLKFKD